MSRPIVSVVIPTYNAPGLLLATLQDVFDQTMTDHEVIVVDDGSTDDTPQRLEPLARDGRIRLIRQANAGIGAARNAGIDAARGKYVCPLDHDDHWLPRKLAEQVAFHDANPALISSSVQWASTGAPDTPMIDRAMLCDARGIVDRPVRANVFVSACLMFDRERIGALRYETQRGAAEDLPFQFDLLNRGPFGVVSDEILARYRVHEGNESSKSSYYANTARSMRALQRAGRFDAFAAADRAIIDGTIASIAQQAFARLILDRKRVAAGKMLIEQWPDLFRARRRRFLAIAPFALFAPRALVRRRWRGESVMP